MDDLGELVLLGPVDQGILCFFFDLYRNALDLTSSILDLSRSCCCCDTVRYSFSFLQTMTYTFLPRNSFGQSILALFPNLVTIFSKKPSTSS